MTFFRGFLVTALLVGSSALEASYCKMQTSSGVDKVSCLMPTCPSGVDCSKPVVEKNNARIEFFEPLIRWREKCPNPEFAGPCWEAQLEYRMRISASDNQEVTSLGLNLAQELSNRRIFRKVWGKVVGRDSQGRLDALASIMVQGPPESKFEISVLEMCAVDTTGNENCVIPDVGTLVNRNRPPTN